MTAHDWRGKTFDGYRITSPVASGDDETLFEGERVRDGDEVWIRVPRARDSASYARLKARYLAEQVAATELRSTGAVLMAREVIELDGAPALVTNRPSGQSLNDYFSKVHGPQSIRAVLGWFKRLVGALESAHEIGIAHGNLSGRAIYLDDRQRVTVYGLATMTGARLVEARQTDARALSFILYRATTGINPSLGFPHTGQPRSPSVIVEGYPPTLARFLVKRLSEESQDDDPVNNAGVFRRSLDAMAVDPEFRRRAGLLRTGTTADLVVETRDALAGMRRFVPWVVATTFLCIACVGVTYLAMQSQVEQVQRRSAARGRQTVEQVAPAAPAVPTGLVEVSEGREAAWTCLHRAFGPTDQGAISRVDIAQCLRLVPEATPAEMAREAARLGQALEESVRVLPKDQSVEAGYHRLFVMGADEVEQHLRYRIARRLSTARFEAWVQANRSSQVLGVLATLSARRGRVAAWARSQLTPEGQGQSRAEVRR